MNILDFGAGVIGSLYAARLKQGGHQVTLLARGARLSQVRQFSVIVKVAQTGKV